MKKQEARSQETGDSRQKAGLRLVCMDCGAELPGSDPAGQRVSHGLCQQDFERRMAELKKEAA
jgi:hypothetical protein